MSTAKHAPEKKEDPKRDPLVITLAELQGLSPEDQTKFRQAGGTVTNNPPE